jgi:adenine-specific DNA-methyltransferase
MSTEEIKTAQTVANEPEKLDRRSFDIPDEKRAELLGLFPEARTEDGKIDFDRLKLALGETVDVGKERYGMNWPGKADCFRTIQTPSVGTLRPAREESVDFDTTENLIIEGDNLEVLKLLQKSYLGKVKMIYIDPPYNTGNDFIYPDNYAESLETYLEYTGQVDDEGKTFATNTETDGRFHSKWLNMMYPRLYLARNLLRDDGVIFVSIDDVEVDNLRKLCNEIFGEENFIATVIWQKYFSPKSTARQLSTDHDYVLLYGRNSNVWSPTLLPRTEEADARYSNPDNDPRGSWTSAPLQARNFYSQGLYEVTSPTGKKHVSPKGTYWRVSEDNFLKLDQENRIWWGEDGNNVPRMKRFLSEVKQGIVPRTLWLHEDTGHTQEAKQELNNFVQFESSDNVLNSVKPTRLLGRMLHIATKSDSGDIVLDFFAGSGVTGHAVLKQNAEDNGNRHFVLVQLPEPLPKLESNLRTIADITKERIRQVIKKYGTEKRGQLSLGEAVPRDQGFRVFKLAESNFKPWDADTPKNAESLGAQLQLHVEHVRDGRSSDDILYELLLKSGFPLTTPVETKTVEGKTVYSAAGGAMVICLDRSLTLDLIRAIADMKPERVVFLDEGFAGNDQLKTNAVQTFKTKGITSFKTV